MPPRKGAYPADRAAALSGVPKSTVHYWARKEILVPSVSAERVKLWSYSDLMGLRVIYWLRQPKADAHGWDVPATGMPMVRKTLDQLRELDLDLWTLDGGPSVAVNRAGKVVVTNKPATEDVNRQQIFDADEFEVLLPFPTESGLQGPDLQAPRPQLRIVPGKLGGSPHIARTRIETRALAALIRRGFSSDNVYRLYPAVAASAIDEAVDLEAQLEGNAGFAQVA